MNDPLIHTAEEGPGLTALKLAAIVFLVLLNGFFVAAEFAIVRVRGTRVDALARAGSRRARMSQHILGHLDAYLSAAQLGITIASILLGWVGEQTMRHEIVEPFLRLFHVTDETVLRVVSFLFGTGVIVFLHVVIGEQAPKWMAIQAPEPTTLWIAYPLRWFHIVMYPFIAVLNSAANAFVRMVGIKSAGEGDLAHSEEELRMLLASSSRVGMIPPEKRALIENIFDISNTIVRQIMVPRTEVVAFDVRKPLADSLRIALRTAHSRYPLIDGDMDHVLGVIHMKDLFWQLNELGQPTGTPAAQVNPMIAGGDIAHHPPASGAEFLRKIARPALLVPETMRVDSLLRQLQQKRVHLAMVVDEFGGISGMVTFENVIEEIVGEVQDEFDQETPRVQRIAEGEYIMDGAANLFDVNQALGTQLAAEDVDTIAGFLLHEFGRLPNPGDHVTVGGYEITVREVRKRRIHRVHARAVSPGEAPAAAPDETRPTET